MRDAFKRAKHHQWPDTRALWRNQRERRTSMRTTTDTSLVSKPRHQLRGHAPLQRGHRLSANRFRLNLTRTPAMYTNEVFLGPGFIPVLPKSEVGIHCKAWCAWLNATPGTVAYANIRQKAAHLPELQPNRPPLATDPDQRVRLTLSSRHLRRTSRPTPRPAAINGRRPNPPAPRPSHRRRGAGSRRRDLGRLATKIPSNPTVNNKHEPLNLG